MAVQAPTRPENGSQGFNDIPIELPATTYREWSDRQAENADSPAGVIASDLTRDEIDEFLNGLSDEELLALQYDWQFWGRPNQHAPNWMWRVWLILAGRGWGKTRTGAEWVREQVEQKGRGRLALVAPTAADARDVMVEGDSGILKISPPWFKPLYEPSKRRLTWPNGAIATLYSAEDPDQLRGPQHEAAWADEIAAWKYPETWDMLMFGLRLGNNPQCVATTTPKPKQLIRGLVKDSSLNEKNSRPRHHGTKGNTYENKDNLAQGFFEDIVTKYEGTTLGRQELHAEILDDVPGALWSRAIIDQHRRNFYPQLQRVVVAVDPAGKAKTTARLNRVRDKVDETGIVVAGKGVDGHAYILGDLSGRWTPHEWGTKAVGAYKLWQGDRIVGETNNGGDMVENTIRTVSGGSYVSFKAITASRGKKARAEPASSLYEKGWVHHVGTMPLLEDQMCAFTDDMDQSPDRVDALVWALSELMLGDEADVPEDPQVIEAFRRSSFYD
jgi:predicted phage terminase large subunit-like protein